MAPRNPLSSHATPGPLSRGRGNSQLESWGSALVAQWIEQEPSNLLVAGSIPAEGAHQIGAHVISSKELEDLARAYLAAYAAKDLESIRSMIAPKVDLQDWNVAGTGSEFFLSQTSDNFNNAASIEIEIKDLLTSDSQVAAQLRILVDEIEELHVVDVIRFDQHGKIASIRAYKC